MTGSHLGERAGIQLQILCLPDRSRVKVLILLKDHRAGMLEAQRSCRRCACNVPADVSAQLTAVPAVRLGRGAGMLCCVCTS